jgi:hypothetical protein
MHDLSGFCAEGCHGLVLSRNKKARFNACQLPFSTVGSPLNETLLGGIKLLPRGLKRCIALYYNHLTTEVAHFAWAFISKKRVKALYFGGATNKQCTFEEIGNQTQDCWIS